MQVRIASAPYLIASKLEAFNNHGDNDLRVSEAITDIGSVLDGRAELCREVAESTEELQAFIRSQFKRLIESQDFLSDLEAHLPRDDYSGARTPFIRQRILDIVNDGCA